MVPLERNGRGRRGSDRSGRDRGGGLDDRNCFVGFGRYSDLIGEIIDRAAELKLDSREVKPSCRGLVVMNSAGEIGSRSQPLTEGLDHGIDCSNGIGDWSTLV